MTLAPREVVEAPAREWDRYPEYKDSGIEWLGDVPAHWNLMGLRRVLETIEQGWSPVADDRVASEEEWGVIKISAVSRGFFRPHEAKALPEDVIPEVRYEVRDGDLLLTRGNTPDLVGDVCVVSGVRPRLMLSDLVYRVSVSSEKIETLYLNYWLLSRMGRYQITRDARGSSQSMVKITQSHLRSWLVALPPISEQQAISAFLDRETRKIDNLIAKRECLIELLEEKRTALISRAVTKGIDPGVPTKDSGVEWLGEIPEHWKVGPLKYETRFINGAAFKPSDWSDEGIPIIRIENLNGGGNFNHTSREVDSRYHIHEEDLLFAWSGNRGTSFGPFVWRGEGLYYLNQHIFRLSNFQCERSWFYWVLKGVITYVEKQAHGIIGLVHITKQELGIVKIPLIPRYEQQAIAEHLDREMEKIDALAGKLREHIEKLREYRTALISAAVTGRIDVREEVSAPAEREPDKMMG